MYVALALAAIVAAALLIFYVFMARSAQVLEIGAASRFSDKADVPPRGQKSGAAGAIAVSMSVFSIFIWAVVRIVRHWSFD